MVKHTQTIRQLLWANCLSVFDHSVELVLKELIVIVKRLVQENVRKYAQKCLFQYFFIFTRIWPKN